MKPKNLAKYLVVLSIIPAVFYFFNPGKIAVITILCAYPIMILFISYLMTSMKKIQVDGGLVIYLFILLNLIIIIRGFIDAHSVEDWKFLVASLIPSFFFIPLTIYLGVYLVSLKVSITTFLQYGFFLSSILLLPTINDLNNKTFAKSTSIIYLFILFMPYLNKKWRYIIISLAVLSFFSDLKNRSNMLNLIIALLISFSFYIRKFFLTFSIMKLARNILLIMPIIFIILGALGVFNIFKISEYTGELLLEVSEDNSQDLMIDSRTKIYDDVLSELNEKNAILWGLGGSGKTKTFLSDIEYADFDVIYKEGRRGTESGMLNYAQYGGIIGVIIYFLLFIKASYLGIYKSRNWLSIMLGLWIAYKGSFAFIEDRLSYSSFSLFLMISIGMCFNESLRNMNEIEVKIFLRSFFEKKYSKFLRLLNFNKSFSKINR